MFAPLFFFALALLSQGLRQEQLTKKGEATTIRQRGTEEAPLVVKRDASERAAEAREHEQERHNKEATDGAIVRYTKDLVLATVGLVLATLALWAATLSVLKSADRNSIRQLRAYIFVHETTEVDRWSGDAFSPTVRMAFRNSGQTPAYTVRTQINQVVAEPDFAGVFELTGGEDVVGNKAPVPPSGLLSIDTPAPIRFSDQERIALQNETLTFYLYGRVTYADAFGNERYANFQYQVLGRGTLRPTQEGNEAN